MSITSNTSQIARPFVKWAGGKSQLLNEIQNSYPPELGKSIKRYCEPFVGGGAVLFDILSNYEMDKVIINDINSELINTYRQIKDNLDELLEQLFEMQEKYWSKNKEEQSNYYYKKRLLFNSLNKKDDFQDNLKKAALFIFLNRTCFNGLYRVNKQGQFNVPIGSYKKPIICDSENLRLVSYLLNKVDILCGDFSKCLNLITIDTFVYIDPPYRPISETAMFTSYNEKNFDDNEQIRLGHFVDDIHRINAKVIVSNSDPKNVCKEDNFFDNLYKEYEIQRVTAKRMINCNGSRRGDINELLITNY